MVLPAFLVVFALLAGLAVLTGDGGEPAGPPPTPVATVAERVEELRDLRFDEVPEAERVAPAQARAEGLADLDRGYPPARRRADEALYERLGLLPEGTDLRDVQSAIFAEQVAGYYDPRTDRLRLVEGAGSGNRVLDEMTLAHELVHALEDQAIGLDLTLADATDDRGLAYRALVEGTATQAMFAYLDEYVDAEVALGALIGSGLSAPSMANLPPFVRAALTFPYLRGREFVARLERDGGWRLVDVALRARPPQSTEQILHPEAWLRVEVPDRIRPPVRDGAEPLATGTFGEWQTGRLLATAGGGRAEAAAGWGGDAYAVWEDAVAVRWSWDSRADADEFRAAIEDVVRDGSLVGEAMVAARGRRVTLAVASDAGVARRLATLGRPGRPTS